jgi:putative metallohydrolase (TIGR04338 family)
VARDAQRAKVYAAEDFVRTMFDRAAARGNRAVDFFGTDVTLPPEGRFASVESVRRYVDDVLALPGVRQAWPTAGPVAVRARRGVAAAHYEDSVIAVPEHGTGWALRELVVLHELAHHFTRTDPPHGPGFVATMCELTSIVMGAELGYVLRVVYAQEGVR